MSDYEIVGVESVLKYISVPTRHPTIWHVAFTYPGFKGVASEYVYAHDELGAIQAARKVWNQK